MLARFPGQLLAADEAACHGIQGVKDTDGQAAARAHARSGRARRRWS